MNNRFEPPFMKLAELHSHWKQVGDKALFGAAAMLGILTVSTIADLIIKSLKNVQDSRKKKKLFEKMLEEHPQLQKVDPELLAKYWESLYHFAPYMAEDPLAAGAYLTQAISRTSSSEFGGPPPDTFNTLVDIHKKMKDTRGRGSKVSDTAKLTTTSVILSELLKNSMNY